MRLCGSALAICVQLFARMSVVILVPALAISSLTGISVEWCVIALGVVTTIYSSVGGFEAVIWSDVVQAVMMLGGLLLIAIIIVIKMPGGLPAAVDIGLEADKFRMLMLTLDPKLPNFYLLALGVVLTQLSFANDQVMAQRIRCVEYKDIKKLSFMTWGVIALNVTLTGIVGILLFAYFKTNPADLLPTMQNDEMIPLFVLKQVPVGITGLIIAALFAASMSTISTSVNTCAVLFGEDFVKRFKKNLSGRQELWVMQGMSIFSGLFGTGMAYYLINSQTPFLQQLNSEMAALFGGGFAGVFALGMFTRRANQIGAIIGIVLSAFIPLSLKVFFPGTLHWSAWGCAGIVGCIFFGYIASCLIPVRKKNLRGLTIYDQIDDNV